MSKKQSHDDEIRKGLDTLQKSGLPLQDPGPNLIPQLQQQIGTGRETALAAIFLLGKIVDSKAVDALVEVEKQTKEKELKKEIRRSLFKLSQRGLLPPKEESVESPSSIFAPSAEIEALMSAVDGGGGRLLWIVKPQPNHGLQLIQAMLDDREGVQRIGGSQLRRKELRQMSHEIKEQHGISMIPVPWEYADALIYEGYEKAKSLGHSSGLEHFHEIRGVVSTVKPKMQPHPIYRRFDKDHVQEGAWRELSRRLLDEPELQYWILDREWAEPFLAQMQEAQSSRLVLNPIQKEERMAGIVRDTVKTISVGDAGKRMQRRMEDMALYFIETGREESARLALAVALQLAAGDPGPLDISFLTGLVQKTFAVYLSQEKSKSAEEPSFILKP